MTDTLVLPALTGFSTGLGLIVVIGAQNAFVLRQGLARLHVFWVCLTCALSDAILIAAGVAGFGTLVAALPWLPQAMRWLGAAFLFGYGAVRFRAAWRGGGGLGAGTRKTGLWASLATCLALTWMNPHVYLDTLFLLGGISAQYAGQARLAFGAGAMGASFVFFFALGYAAQALAPVLHSARAWRVIDGALGVLMWVLAALLVGGGV